MEVAPGTVVAVPMTILEELKEFDSLEQLQALFRDPRGRDRLCRLGVRTALVATWDGLLIDSAVCTDEPVELESLAAHAAAALQLSHTGQSSRTRVDGVMAEFDDGGTIIVDPVGDNSLVAFVTRTPSDVARLRAELRALARRPEALASPNGSPAPDGEGAVLDTPAPPADHTEPAAGPVGPAPPPPGPQPRPAVPVRDGLPTPPAARRATGRRIILREVRLEVTGRAATAVVTLALDGSTVTGKAVGRSEPEQHLFIAAQATARAVTALLPQGYGVELERIIPVASEMDATIRAAGVKVLFLTPAGEETLLGIARIAGDEPVAAAKTVLSAVNGHIEMVLAGRRSS
jgi:predicted regulator of Ras-like GTPase activity (Roadblock/LC7/MglB family)